ncbi:hypothetical protein MRX96_007781 [Rhipicephalus microplus]
MYRSTTSQHTWETCRAYRPAFLNGASGDSVPRTRSKRGVRVHRDGGRLHCRVALAAPPAAAAPRASSRKRSIRAQQWRTLSTYATHAGVATSEKAAGSSLFMTWTLRESDMGTFDGGTRWTK